MWRTMYGRVGVCNVKPERNIPDIPENKRVRDFLRSMPLTGHGAAFGKTIYVVQCYRCKVGDGIDIERSATAIGQVIQSVSIL